MGVKKKNLFLPLVFWYSYHLFSLISRVIGYV
jgi:hypothetical protein